MAPEAGFQLATETFSGTVVESLDAGGYTYFRLRSPDGLERWVVALGRRHRGERRLAVTSYGRRLNFESRRLRRTFAVLYFGSVAPA